MCPQRSRRAASSLYGAHGSVEEGSSVAETLFSRGTWRCCCRPILFACFVSVWKGVRANVELSPFVMHIFSRLLVVDVAPVQFQGGGKVPYEDHVSELRPSCHRAAPGGGGTTDGWRVSQGRELECRHRPSRNLLRKSGPYHAV